jgi:hypothetical protein
MAIFSSTLKRAKSHKVLETLGKAPVAINTVIGVQVALKRVAR